MTSLFKCQICYEPVIFMDMQFCDKCFKEINKRYEKKFRKRAMSEAIREVTLEIRHKQYQERLK